MAEALSSRVLIEGRRDDDLRRATLAAMRARPQAETIGVSDHEWLEFAERNRVGPLVAHALLDRDGNPAIGPARAIHDASAARMRVLMDQLDEVADALARESIGMIALKNAGIARAIHPCPACCPMGDIDTLVERDRFLDAHRIVLEQGFRFASRAEEIEPAELAHALTSGGAEYVKHVGDCEVWLEVQWRAVAGRWIRPEQEPTTTELLSRAQAVPGSAVLLLSREDNLLQVGLHTAKHSYVRAPGLRLHTDVDRLSTWAEPDWDVVVDRARELTVTTALYVSLALARELLGSPIPREVLSALEPASWKLRVIAAMLRRSDLFEPDEHKFSRPEMMVFHALLYDSASSLAASALDTRVEHLGLRYLPQNLRSGVRRIHDLATRYQR